MDKPTRLIALIISIILGGSLIAATFVVANAFYNVKALSNSISVTGSAEKTITSDVAKWSSSFSRTVDAANLKDGYTGMKHDLDIITAYLKAHGVNEKEITVQPVNISENTSCDVYTSDKSSCATTHLSGYTLTQSILVESNSVDGTTKLAQDTAGALVDQGIVFQSSPIEYYYSKIADLKIEMLGEATQSALDRADKIVGSSNSKLGNLQSAAMGVFQVTSLNSTDISDYGTYDTSSLTKKVTAIVRASYSVN